MSNLEKAKKLFAKNTEKHEVFFTQDGYPFFEKTKAEAHAGTLSNRMVETITRGEVLSPTPEGETEPNPELTELEIAQRNAQEQEAISHEEKGAVATNPVQEPEETKSTNLKKKK